MRVTSDVTSISGQERCCDMRVTCDVTCITGQERCCDIMHITCDVTSISGQERCCDIIVVDATCKCIQSIVPGGSQLQAIVRHSISDAKVRVHYIALLKPYYSWRWRTCHKFLPLRIYQKWNFRTKILNSETIKNTFGVKETCAKLLPIDNVFEVHYNNFSYDNIVM